MIAYSFIANFAVKPRFSHIFLKIHHYEFLLSTITYFMATHASFMFAHDVENIMYFQNVYNFTILSHTYEKLCRDMQT